MLGARLEFCCATPAHFFQRDLTASRSEGPLGNQHFDAFLLVMLFDLRAFELMIVR